MTYTRSIATTTSANSHRSSALIDHLARLTRLRTEAALAPFGMRPRHLVTLTLLRNHGGAQQQALASALQIDRTNLVGLLNELERAGYVERRRSAEDRRRHLVELTPAGKQALTDAESALAAAEDEVLGALDAEEREALYRLLRRATGNHVVLCPDVAAEREPAA